MAKLITDFTKAELQELRTKQDKKFKDKQIRIYNSRIKQFESEYKIAHYTHINLSKQINKLLSSGNANKYGELQELLGERNQAISEKFEAKEIVRETKNDLNQIKGKDFYVTVVSYKEYKILYSELAKFDNPFVHILERNIRAIQRDLRKTTIPDEITSKRVILQKNIANLEVIKTGNTLNDILYSNKKKYKELIEFLEGFEKQQKEKEKGKKKADKTKKPSKPKSTENYPFFYQFLPLKIYVF